MHLQIGVFNVQRQLQAFALDGAGERGGDVEVEGIAELVGPGCAAGLDPGGKVAGVMTSKTGFSQRAHQVAQGLEAEKVQTLVGNFELGLLGFARLAANTRLLRRVVGLIDADVVFLFHAFDQLLDEFVERPVHLHLAQALLHFFVQQISVH